MQINIPLGWHVIVIVNVTVFRILGQSCSGWCSNLCRRYSILEAFAHLQQGSDELIEIYLHHASELLSKIHHTMDMSQVLAEDLNHHTMLYWLNSVKLKDKVVGHWSAYRKTMGYCFSDIHVFSARNERSKGYSADIHTQEVPIIKEVKSTKEPGPCFKCSGPHFERKCTKNIKYSNDKSQNYEKIDNPHILANLS